MHKIEYRHGPGDALLLCAYLPEGFTYRHLDGRIESGAAAREASARHLLDDLRAAGYHRAQVMVDGKRIRAQRQNRPQSGASHSTCARAPDARSSGAPQSLVLPRVRQSGLFGLEV